MYLATLNNINVNDIENNFTLLELDGDFKTEYLGFLAISYEYTKTQIMKSYISNIKINVGDING